MSLQKKMDKQMKSLWMITLVIWNPRITTNYPLITVIGDPRPTFIQTMKVHVMMFKMPFNDKVEANIEVMTVDEIKEKA